MILFVALAVQCNRPTTISDSTFFKLYSSFPYLQPETWCESFFFLYSFKHRKIFEEDSNLKRFKIFEAFEIF